MKLKKSFVLLLIILFLFGSISVPCSAQSDEDLTSPEENITITSGDSSNTESTSNNNFNLSENENNILTKWQLFFRLMLAVTITIVLGIAAIYFSRNILPKITKAAGKNISVIETVHLGPRKSLHIIEVDNRRILIGSTNENINTIADITKMPFDFSVKDTNVDF
ncbi:flagellar biosynthetic protein FliO [Planctomycetota bacterium]